MATPTKLISAIPDEEYQRRLRRANSPRPDLWLKLDAVTDPEIPVVSIWDLGVLQDVEISDEDIVVTITPTYSGCPAMESIEQDIIKCLSTSGLKIRVRSRLAPAWSTSWISDDARQALKTYGIAPPSQAGEALCCPRCGSTELRTISEFGSTACKALFQCLSCHEPFDHFKPF